MSRAVIPPTAFVQPDWPAPPRVRAAMSLRGGGVSTGAWSSLNLASHVGDAPEAVAENRRRLREALQLPAEPQWLDQVHGTEVVMLPQPGIPRADASHTRVPGVVCAVLTADCLPVLLCDREGRAVAAAHAGWRGLLDGVLERSVAAMDLPSSQLMAWLGACIGPLRFEVGAEVREAFVTRDAAAASAFMPHVHGKFLASLPLLARQRLQAAGVTAIYGGNACTHTQAADYFSHRRDGRCGRMATLVWLQD